MDFNRERVRQNAKQAETEDLLDRVTVYRDGMEPEAIAIIEAELRSRGLGREGIEDHAAKRQQSAIQGKHGLPLRCSFCDRPAVARRWGWHRVRGRGIFAVLTAVVPLYRPRHLAYCSEHQATARR